MTWLIIGALIWVSVAIPVSVLVGRAVRLAEQRREPQPGGVPEPNFVASEEPVVQPDEDEHEGQWTGPGTVPFAPSRPPWGGDRTYPRLPPVVHRPVHQTEREPNAARERDRP